MDLVCTQAIFPPKMRPPSTKPTMRSPFSTWVAPSKSRLRRHIICASTNTSWRWLESSSHGCQNVDSSLLLDLDAQSEGVSMGKLRHPCGCQCSWLCADHGQCIPMSTSIRRIPFQPSVHCALYRYCDAVPVLVSCQHHHRPGNIVFANANSDADAPSKETENNTCHYLQFWVLRGRRRCHQNCFSSASCDLSPTSFEVNPHPECGRCGF